MFDVFLYVGLRRGDAARLGKQHIRNGVIASDDGKERRHHADLCPGASGLGGLDQRPVRHPASRSSRRTTARTTARKWLGNAFREAVVAAGIPVSKKGSDDKGYSAHGLRKASATIAAELRCNRSPN